MIKLEFNSSHWAINFEKKKLAIEMKLNGENTENTNV